MLLFFGICALIAGSQPSLQHLLYISGIYSGWHDDESVALRAMFLRVGKCGLEVVHLWIEVPWLVECKVDMWWRDGISNCHEDLDGLT